MKYGSREVLDLMVFDEEGKFVTKLDTLKNSMMKFEQNPRLYIRDALLDIELLKFMQYYKESNLSDFDTYIRLTNTKTITFNKNNLGRKCKLIATTTIRNSANAKDDLLVYEIPSAMAVNYLEHDMDMENPSVFDLAFDVEEYNDEGDMFKIHITKG